MARSHITRAGREALVAELARRKTSERPRIIAAISEARAHGDLSENAEYHAAKEQQGFNETKIAELEKILAESVVVDVGSLSGDRVVFGATVTCAVSDDNGEEEKRYQIVGEPEADVAEGRISSASPIARAMIGKRVGDAFDVKAPVGSREYEILKIEFIP